LAGEQVERRRMVILAADVAGHSRLVALDEEGTLPLWKAQWRELIDPKVLEHGGRVVGIAGQLLLVEFKNVIAAACCAVELQRAMLERNAGGPHERVAFRIGINVGHIITDGAGMWGIAVYVAAHLAALAKPGGICISGRVHEDLRGKLEVAFEDQGERKLKNIARPVRVYRVLL
jgi:adenylate cyclase